MLSDSGFSIQIDRTRCRPWGIDGGGEGEGADGTIEPADGEAYRLLKGVTELKPGDRFRSAPAAAAGSARRTRAIPNPWPRTWRPAM